MPTVVAMFGGYDIRARQKTKNDVHWVRTFALAALPHAGFSILLLERQYEHKIDAKTPLVACVWVIAPTNDAVFFGHLK